MQRRCQDTHMPQKTTSMASVCLAGVAEDVLSLFLKASMSWQEHCQVLTEGCFVPYNQAKVTSRDESLFVIVNTMHG